MKNTKKDLKISFASLMVMLLTYVTTYNAEHGIPIFLGVWLAILGFNVYQINK